MANGSHWVLSSCGHDGTAEQFLDLARQFQEAREPHLAAVAYDRAWGLNPHRAEIIRGRRELLDELSVKLAGIVFRYVPGGSFLMGSEHGDADEMPVHAVQLDPFWISGTPISLARYWQVMDWAPAPAGHPMTPLEDEKAKFLLHEKGAEIRIRQQYCEDRTLRAHDWHAHVLGEVSREQPDLPWTYDEKPMVAVSWQCAEELCACLTERHSEYRFRLPTEAEWEKAARAGLIGARYSWGNEPPDAYSCDFDRFDSFSIKPMRGLPPNGYGLYAMCGGVWEWTGDWYDAEYHGESPRHNPTGPADGKERVLRGGSWADCAAAVTVSFRCSRSWGKHYCPNIGFRVCCVGLR